ncbi:MAG TPA: T9SS type A sorting domain-containing protein [Ferruginibacter sp.]|nr:T9SS type A sorting domain-containing protein [Ferruginibacter sp.]HMP22234.1 T9SS type A sorting domain-containing protein [Ferruginibacter sp.]
MLALCQFAIAQKKAYQPPPVPKRCGTMEALWNDINNNPALKAQIEKNKADYDNYLLNRPQTAQKPGNVLTLPGPVTIPVVVHIVLPNPWMITDAMINNFISRLNLDFSGLNPDSTNAVSFYPVRGHSQLRFALARRDIAGNFTTGILRVPGTTQIAFTTNQPVKNSATPTGGSTGWDVSRYYNIYVADGTSAGVLGIAPAIGPGGPAGANNADGVCIDYRSFAGGCFGYPEYNLGRTGVHEVGHNFGLYHPFDNGCGSNDFAQLTSNNCSLPFSLLSSADDTPPQADASGGCPSSGTLNGCNPPNQRMFQSYMDYTYDACYSMFSKGSVARMEWILENCRSGYLTSTGAQLPANTAALDAGIHSVVNPGGYDFDSATCTPLQYPDLTCPGNFTPQIRIVNQGINTLTSVTVTTTINGINPVSNTYAVHIPTGMTRVLVLPAQQTVTGINNLRFTVSNPNNSVDGNAANDTLTISFTVSPALALPYSESFEAPVFPPNNGTRIINPDDAITWIRVNGVGNPGSNSMAMNLYAYEPDADGNVGQRDIYQLPKIDATILDSVTLAFNVAYRQYDGPGVPFPPNDSLRVLYSTDCGITWQVSEYAKGGPSLVTVTPPTDSSFIPFSPRQWRTEKLVFKNFCERNISSLVLAFECINDWGNNLFIDSIDIKGYQSVNTNAALKSITQPLAAICRTTAITPEVVLGNSGLDTLKSLTVNYNIDNGPLSTINWTGSLAKCDSAIISLGQLSTTIGTHIITVYVTNPNGTADQAPQNDTIRKVFTVYPEESMPISEGFEDAGFPGTRWGVQNVNGGTTFERSTGAARSGLAAMKMNNPNTANFNGAVDYLVSPIATNSAFFDSVFVDFDYAYRQGPTYPGSTVLPLDTLEVLTTNDCGLTFNSVWKKWGYQLQTINDPSYSNTDVFTPTLQSEWRHERVFLSPAIGAADFQVYFVMKGNRQNNLWLDNINIASITLPQRLKDEGYLIYPNPSNGSFLLHHYNVDPPVSLQSIQAFTAAGQLVWQKTYNGNAERRINIDLQKVPAGVYVLKIVYRDKTVVEKIVKQ